MEGFGEKLKKIRESRGLSQQDVANLLNVKSATVSSWEVDRTEPKMEYLCKLAEYYNLTLDDIVNGRTFSAKTASDESLEKRFAAYLEGFAKQLRKEGMKNEENI